MGNNVVKVSKPLFKTETIIALCTRFSDIVFALLFHTFQVDDQIFLHLILNVKIKIDDNFLEFALSYFFVSSRKKFNPGVRKKNRKWMSSKLFQITFQNM